MEGAPRQRDWERERKIRFLHAHRQILTDMICEMSDVLCLIPDGEQGRTTEAFLICCYSEEIHAIAAELTKHGVVNNS